MSFLANILKRRGDRLFAKGNFKAALERYTRAIALDDSNATLWTNRSACHLSLKQYLNACGDASKARALDIDPKHYKAYVRLATAQDTFKTYLPSSRSWEWALDAMPKENLTPAQEKQKIEYTTRLGKALLNFLEMSTIPLEGPLSERYGNEESGYPWDVAASLVAGLREKRNAKSSAWVITYAAKEYDEGVRRMKTAYIKTDENGVERCGRVGCWCMDGEEDAFALVCDGMLLDIRCTHFKPVNEWISAHNTCGTLERQRHNPWIGLGPDHVKREMPIRVQKLGWDRARPDFDLTIRFWLLRGMVECVADDNILLDAEYAKQALNLLEWGREKFRDVSVEEKGEIFDDTFIRSVRNHCIRTMITVYAMSKKADSDRAEWLEPAMQQVDLMLQELENDPGPREPSWVEGERDPGWFLSNYDYLKGHAYSCKAFYHSDLASARSGDEQAINNKIAARFYVQAAECYPIDDEDCAKYLNCAFQHATRPPGCTVGEALDLANRARDAYDASGKIWRAHPTRRRQEAEESHQALMDQTRVLQTALDTSLTTHDSMISQFTPPIGVSIGTILC
ncbi:hypothetical protein GALMADRAFT_140613 [Galerina marginata CBS 339.88]|uniref:Uncharacterized protein n=1 Tax=Galerina marginata (strain CBS 339.88) TaxID=685588 RepID=A0A067T7U6_GALM3|nr:hypothetical protein GALMADRAFT_140613 [Galerina marginata CBS 339.88]